MAIRFGWLLRYGPASPRGLISLSNRRAPMEVHHVWLFLQIEGVPFSGCPCGKSPTIQGDYTPGFWKRSFLEVG